MADSFDAAFADLGIDPNWAQGGINGNPPPYLGGAGAAPPQSSAPQQGQWAPNNQGFLDWATKNYGADKNSFVKLPQGQGLQDVLKRYTAETGNQANFLGGPSGDRVDFGQGAQDALTSSGQIWNNENPGAGGSAAPQSWTEGGGPQTGGPGGYGGFGGGGSPGTLPMPTAPTATDLNAPDPFTYAPSTMGTFNAPSQTPTSQALTYNPVAAPDAQQAQQVGTPQALSYNPMSTPTAFSGDRQQTPQALSATGLDTPSTYTPEKYTGLTAEQFAADPGRQFRESRALAAQENSLAHMGSLRTGNAVNALSTLASDLASQEYGAAEGRARATNQQNNAQGLGAFNANAQTGLAYNQNTNQNALQFGQANISNQFNANEANYGRSANEAQQGFQNQFAVNQANNQGQFQTGQANISNQLNATQANNQANLAYGGQNFQQGLAANQANNQGQFTATQANNQNALTQQNQQFNQAATGYGLNQAAQNQQYQQALGAYGQNAQTQLAYGSQNQNNQLANYQAQTNAALGLGNLNLGYQNSAQNYALGQGGLGIQQGQLGLATQGQNFNQGLATYDRNYQATVTDPWNQQYQLANMGNPGAPNTQGNANQQSDYQTQQGNAGAAGTVGAANQYGQMAQNLGQTGQQAAYLAWLRSQPQNRSVNQQPSM